MAATPQCAPADACPGSGFVIDTDGNIQILGSTVVTFDADIHEGLFLDCARQAGQGQIFGWRANRRIYTAAERAALAGGNLFRGLRVLESDTMREYVYYGATTGWLPEWSLPWGDLSVVDLQTSVAAIVGPTAAESVTVTTTAVQTFANRRYEIALTCEVQNSANFTAFGTVRVRRGTTTAGAIVKGPIGISKGGAANARQMLEIAAFDQPGAQAAQRWCLTVASDGAGTFIAANPSLAIVRDMGPSGSAPAV